MKTQDQLLLEQAYQRIRISESDLALSVKQSGSLEDFLKLLRCYLSLVTC